MSGQHAHFEFQRSETAAAEFCNSLSKSNRRFLPLPRPNDEPGLERTNPDVAELDRVPVILQKERHLQRMRRVFGSAAVHGGSFDLDIVLHKNPVVNHGDERVGGGIQAWLRVPCAPHGRSFAGLPLPGSGGGPIS